MNKASLLSERMKKYAHSDTAALYNDLDITRNGLRLEQVEAMKKKYGDNNIVARKADTIWFRLRRALINPFTIILFILAIVSFITDVWHTNSLNKNATTVITLSVIILVSGVVRFIQEIRSKYAYDQLDRLVHTHVNVKKDGVIIKIPAEDLVVGDCVYLAAGDRVPEDMRLTNTLDLFVSQSAITGESGILEKNSRQYGAIRSKWPFLGTKILSLWEQL